MKKLENEGKVKGNVPDLIGFKLELAQRKLTQVGIPFLVKETIPVRPATRRKAEFITEAAVLRVIRQKTINNQDRMVELVVAREVAALFQEDY